MRTLLTGIIIGLLIGSVLFNIYLMRDTGGTGYTTIQREQMDKLAQAMGE
jgi:predicted aspartyl protease